MPFCNALRGVFVEEEEEEKEEKEEVWKTMLNRQMMITQITCIRK